MPRDAIVPDVYSLSDAPEVAQMVGFKMEVISDRRGGNKSWGKCSPLKLRGGSLCGNPQSALNRASVKLLNFLSPARARRYHNVAAAPSSLASFHRGGREGEGICISTAKPLPLSFPSPNVHFALFLLAGNQRGPGSERAEGGKELS